MINFLRGIAMFYIVNTSFYIKKFSSFFIGILKPAKIRGRLENLSSGWIPGDECDCNKKKGEMKVRKDKKDRR
ncbi:MAG: hypothetical protein Q4D32_06835, partial [Eubacteriales bacterium]|nr:hypothetical protein [Eubacteriales bacterium]